MVGFVFFIICVIHNFGFIYISMTQTWCGKEVTCNMDKVESISRDFNAHSNGSNGSCDLYYFF